MTTLGSFAKKLNYFLIFSKILDKHKINYPLIFSLNILVKL